MRHIYFLIPLLPITAAADAKPPRELSPASQEALAGVGAGNSDTEVASAIAAASASPLGSLQNPVRVEGPEGARAYVARLRCADGSAPRVGASAPAGVGAFGSVTEAFPLDCGKAAPGKFTAIVDIYHEGHVERHAPAGFTID